jgi:hypothetical protein
MSPNREGGQGAVCGCSRRSTFHEQAHLTWHSLPPASNPSSRPVQVRSPDWQLLPVNLLGLLDEPNLKLLDALPDEADETLPFCDQGVTFLLEQRFEGLYKQGGASAWESSPLSYSGRKRGGGVGVGQRGRSIASRARNFELRSSIWRSSSGRLSALCPRPFALTGTAGKTSARQQ